ncbi:MAG: TolC family protein [Thermodesulfobacteriota bacterium]
MKRIILVFTVLVAALGWTSLAQAKTLQAMLVELLDTHERMQAAVDTQTAAEYGVRTAKAGWKPKVDLTGDFSYEDYDNSNRASQTTGMYRNKEKLRATQLLWDFGRTDSVVGSSVASQDKAVADKVATRQGLLREGVAAYLNLIRYSKILGYALHTRDNFKKLMEIEQAKLKAGQGDELKVLQAKGQMEASKAFVVQAEMDYGLAQNRFQAVYTYALPDADVAGLSEDVVPVGKLPATSDDAIGAAHADNPQLKSLAQAVSLADAQLEAARSRFYPSFNAYFEYERKENDQNKAILKKENRYGMEFAWNLYNGGGDTALEKTAVHTRSAAQNTLLDLQRTVDEAVRNAWVQLLNSRARAEMFRSQAETEGKFLEKAKKEREIGGETSLTDLLLAENNWITAQIGVTTAEFDQANAAFDLFFAMGRLELDLFLN